MIAKRHTPTPSVLTKLQIIIATAQPSFPLSKVCRWHAVCLRSSSTIKWNDKITVTVTQALTISWLVRMAGARMTDAAEQGMSGHFIASQMVQIVCS